MKHLTVVMAMVFATISYAQEKAGYYITANNETVEGYLQAKDFLKPETVQFSVSQSGSYSPIDITNIKEYGIKNELKLQKHTVDIDIISTQESNSRNPLWDKRTVFLNVIIEGDASLYSYEGELGVRYFYGIKSKDIPIKQLVYRKYKSSPLIMSENVMFRQQLFNDLSCENQKSIEFSKASYNRDDLSYYVEQYNKCTFPTETIKYTSNNEKRVAVKYSVYIGFDSHTVGIKSSENTIISTEDKNISPSIGIDLAMLIIKNNLEFFGRLEYERLSGKVENIYQVSDYTYFVEESKLKSDILNIYLGMRKNISIAQKHSVFAEAALGISAPFGKWDFNRYTDSFDRKTQIFGSEINLKSAFSINPGLGYVFNDKYGIVFRYATNRNFFSGIGTKDETKITKFTVNFRYTFN